MCIAADFCPPQFIVVCDQNRELPVHSSLVQDCERTRCRRDRCSALHIPGDAGAQCKQASHRAAPRKPEVGDRSSDPRPPCGRVCDGGDGDKLRKTVIVSLRGGIVYSIVFPIF